MKRLSILLALSSCIYSTSALASPVVSITPGSLTFSAGNQVTASIGITGLDPNRALGTFDIVLGFDSTLLQFSSFSFGNQLDLFGLGDLNSVTPAATSVELFELSLESATDLNSLQQAAFSLGTINFTALGTGNSSPLSLTLLALGDSSGNSLLQPNVALTPEPPSIILVLSSLLIAALALHTSRPQLNAAKSIDPR